MAYQTKSYLVEQAPLCPEMLGSAGFPSDFCASGQTKGGFWAEHRWKNSSDRSDAFSFLLFPSLISKSLSAEEQPSLRIRFTKCVGPFDFFTPLMQKGCIQIIGYWQRWQFKLNDFLVLQIRLFKTGFIRRNMKQKLDLSP